jgi:hypothetical protein
MLIFELLQLKMELFHRQMKKVDLLLLGFDDGLTG